MAVRHRFVYRWPDNVTPTTLESWVQTLSQQEKEEFLSAQCRQRQYRKEAINQGRMVIDSGTYVWRDEQTARENKPTDEIWHRYFRRYLQETQTEFSIEEELC